jgi:hypothetical protein
MDPIGARPPNKLSVAHSIWLGFAIRLDLTCLRSLKKLSSESGIKKSSDRGHLPIVIRKADLNGPPGLGSQGAIHSNFGASTGVRRHTPGTRF